MSGTAQGLVAIRITRRYAPYEPPVGGEPAPDKDGVVKTVHARLLTREMCEKIRRQNVDCADINCMKWPILGLGRYATFKCLLLKSDLAELIPKDAAMSTRGFEVWFIVGSEEQSKTTRFPRMHLAHIHPLMVSEMGDPNKGEALYLCTFHCDRWAARSYRISQEDGKRYWGHGWDPSLQQKMSAPLTVDQVVDDIFNGGRLNKSGWWPFFRNTADDSIDVYEDDVLGGGGNWVNPPGEGILIGLGAPWRRPTLQWLDDLAARCGCWFAYLPYEDQDRPEGRMHVIASRVERGASWQWLNQYRNDIIAGSMTSLWDDPPEQQEAERATEGAGGPIYWEGFARKAPIDGIVVTLMAPHRHVVNVRRALPGNGLPPDVFGQVEEQSDTLGTGQFRSSLPDPFSRSPVQEYNSFLREDIFGQGFIRELMGPDGESRMAFYQSDKWRRDAADASLTPDVYPNFPSDADNKDYFSHRLRYMYEADTCDIWLRGWTLPLGRASWAGGSWVELRLQTDGEGFGFPTTRIHGSLEDPLLAPMEDTGCDIEVSGLAQAWRGQDGRTHVHVPQPFVIPCMISIYAHEQIATNVWRYSARPAHRLGSDAASLGAGQDYYGGITKWASLEIIAYNTVELNNTSTFAGPGYKLPLVETGFDVLPIGKDRDGTIREVVVMAFLAMSFQGGPNRVVAYFTMHNPIDGECST